MYLLSCMEIAFSVPQGPCTIHFVTISNNFGFVCENGISTVTTVIVIFVHVLGSIDKVRSVSAMWLSTSLESKSSRWMLSQYQKGSAWKCHQASYILNTHTVVSGLRSGHCCPSISFTCWGQAAVQVNAVNKSGLPHFHAVVTTSWSFSCIHHARPWKTESRIISFPLSSCSSELLLLLHPIVHSTFPLIDLSDYGLNSLV